MVSIIVIIVAYRSTEVVLEVSDSTACRRELTFFSFDMCQVPSRHHVEVRVFASPRSNNQTPLGDAARKTKLRLGTCQIAPED